MTIAVILKRLYQAPRNRVHQKSFRRALFGVLPCLLAILVFLAAYGPPVWGQKAPVPQERATVSPPRVQEGTIDLDQYVAEGYAIHGPYVLQSVSPKALVFPGRNGKKGIEISLANKPVVVMDAAGNIKSFSALGPGVSVLVCYRKDRVVIYLVSAAKGRSPNA